AKADAPASTKPQAEPELAPWVEPVDGACPLTHPVKANVDSGIFHVEGGLSYERTKPDRCYATPAAAEKDGLRAAKR
ncbi:MAG: nuclease, partial [Actinomycetota bacterium]|nr:nuclease [Actinomycetota bacterium]